MARKLPLSMTGDNMFAVECEPTGRCGSYTVCQHTIWAYKENRLKGFDDCREAIDKRTCPAIKMMLAERKAGKALFFDSYQAMVEQRIKREQVLAEERAMLRRRPSKAIVPSRLDPETIEEREKALHERWEEENDTAARRIAKSRQTRSMEPDDASSNMFAAVVNELAKNEAN